jgi:hypothetical protein
VLVCTGLLRVYIVVSTIYLPYNIFSFVAVICTFCTIICSVIIIIEPFLSNILTFQDPITLSPLSNPPFFRSYPRLLLNFINNSFARSGILSPYLSLLLFLVLGTITIQQLDLRKFLISPNNTHKLY